MKIATRARRYKEILMFSHEDTRKNTKKHESIPSFPQNPITPISHNLC